MPDQDTVTEADEQAGARPGRGRIVAMVVITVICLAGAGAYLWRAARTEPGAADAPPAAEPMDVTTALAEPHLMFLDDNGDTHRRVAVGPLRLPAVAEDGTDPRLLTPVRCQRVYFAGGRGLCVEASPFEGSAYILDEDLQVVHELGVTGLPSRARVSPDGSLGALTVFVTGHSYAEGGFSTATMLVDMETGEDLGNLEDEFTVLRDGEPFEAVDFNFWGVTFADDPNRFYATLGTGDSTYLLEGDLAARTLTVLRDNVECPSLSPDGTRIAFKKRVSGGGLFESVRWQLHLLDLETMEETPLGDPRSVDDQVEWLDDTTLIYSVRDEEPPVTIRPDLWVLPLGGEPYRVAVGASSPTVVPGRSA